jgi:hypothetical protein
MRFHPIAKLIGGNAHRRSPAAQLQSRDLTVGDVAADSPRTDAKQLGGFRDCQQLAFIGNG